jgi:hypothetical protein
MVTEPFDVLDHVWLEAKVTPKISLTFLATAAASSSVGVGVGAGATSDDLEHPVNRSALQIAKENNFFIMIN